MSPTAKVEPILRRTSIGDATFQRKTRSAGPATNPMDASITRIFTIYVFTLCPFYWLHNFLPICENAKGNTATGPVEIAFPKSETTSGETLGAPAKPALTNWRRGAPMPPPIAAPAAEPALRGPPTHSWTPTLLTTETNEPKINKGQVLQSHIARAMEPGMTINTARTMSQLRANLNPDRIIRRPSFGLAGTALRLPHCIHRHQHGKGCANSSSPYSSHVTLRQR